MELEEFRSKAKAEANLKAKIAEAEGKLMCTKCQAEMMPNAEGVYEFESWQGGAAAARPAQGHQAAPQTSAVESSDMMMQEDEVVDLMSFDMDPDEEDKIKRTLVEKTKYKEVAPTWELNIEVRMMMIMMVIMMMIIMKMMMVMIINDDDGNDDDGNDDDSITHLSNCNSPRCSHIIVSTVDCCNWTNGYRH